MELNKEIREILIEFAMIVQEEKYTNSQVLIRSTYDTFRIQNIVEKLSIHDVSKSVVCGNCDGWGYTVDENGRRKEHCKECE